MSQKKRGLAVLVVILGAVFLAGACHKKQVAAPPPPPTPPPPAPPAPTVTLTAEPSTIEKGQSVTLSWRAENATSLDLEPGVGSVQAQGSTSVSPSESTTYTITATGPGGTNSQSARVTVTVPPPPPPPPPVATVSDEDLFAREVKDAYFDFDKSDIRPDAEQALTTDGNFLKEHQAIKFTIEGNCDERGSEEYNLGLGDRRATAAKNFLVNLGVSVDRISTISFGRSRAAHCTDDDCWQKDRHDHFKIGTESK